MHKGNQNELFFFYHNEKKEVSYAEFDLENAMDENYDLDLKVNLILNRHCYSLPKKKYVDFIGSPQEFLKRYFRINEKDDEGKPQHLFYSS